MKRRVGSGKNEAAALRWFALAVVLISAPSSAWAQATNNDSADDAQSFRNEVLYGMPDREAPFPESSLLATAPGAEQQARVPVFSFRILAPLGYNSNAEAANSGGTRTAEGSPEVRLGFASQIPTLPLRISASVAVEWDRFVSSDSADFDKLRPRLDLQYVDPEDDQAFSPFLGFSPRLDFTPDFYERFSTRYDLNLGFNKAFHFQEGFERVPASGNSASATVWSFGTTILAQRRFREPSPSSTALYVIPSFAYSISEDWSAVLAVELIQRWFDRTDDFSREDTTLFPIAALEFDVPDRWLGGPELARWLGHPALEFFGGYEYEWSNVSNGDFEQWTGGFALRAGWRF
ncbi:hypothetical protein MYXO_02226 [Myxococcaceae bacterium]|nr:hypothetical protein MYXO_02226 [Myxococcaceae bacterium]